MPRLQVPILVNIISSMLIKHLKDDIYTDYYYN